MTYDGSSNDIAHISIDNTQARFKPQQIYSTGVIATREVYVPKEDIVVRILTRFENTSNVPVSIDMESYYYFYSNQNIVSYSENNTQTSRYWIADDANDWGGRDTFGLVLAHQSSTVPVTVTNPSTTTSSRTTKETVVLAPGQTVSLLSFYIQDAESIYVYLRTQDIFRDGKIPLENLDRETLASIINFPIALDTDLDGLADKDEVPLGTDPFDNDTDQDGLEDGWEIRYGFDPTTPGEESQDPDFDGLTNLEEQMLGTNPLVADTDGDSLSDGAEVKHPLYPSDPLMSDTSILSQTQRNCALVRIRKTPIRMATPSPITLKSIAHT
jgi:hypothetical protein